MCLNCGWKQEYPERFESTFLLWGNTANRRTTELLLHTSNNKESYDYEA